MINILVYYTYTYIQIQINLYVYISLYAYVLYIYIYRLSYHNCYSSPIGDEFIYMYLHICIYI